MKIKNEELIAIAGKLDIGKMTIATANQQCAEYEGAFMVGRQHFQLTKFTQELLTTTSKILRALSHHQFTAYDFLQSQLLPYWISSNYLIFLSVKSQISGILRDNRKMFDALIQADHFPNYRVVGPKAVQEYRSTLDIFSQLLPVTERAAVLASKLIFPHGPAASLCVVRERLKDDLNNRPMITRAATSWMNIFKTLEKDYQYSAQESDVESLAELTLRLELRRKSDALIDLINTPGPSVRFTPRRSLPDLKVPQREDRKEDRIKLDKL